MFRLIKAELGAEYVEVLHGESVLGRGPFLKVNEYHRVVFVLIH